MFGCVAYAWDPCCAIVLIVSCALILERKTLSVCRATHRSSTLSLQGLSSGRRQLSTATYRACHLDTFSKLDDSHTLVSRSSSERVGINTATCVLKGFDGVSSCLALA